MIRKIIQLSILMVGLLLTSGAWATTYYIDWGQGADTNNGTSKSTPWKRAPGMIGCSNNCLAYQTSHSDATGTSGAGNQFILKGGVTWPNAALSWDWIYGIGTQANPIYFGAGDKTWYSGASWTRPILDAQGNLPTPSQYFGGMFRVYGNWFIVDNIEFTGMFQTSASSPNLFAFVSYFGVQTAGEVKNCYFHGWSRKEGTTSDTMILFRSTSLDSPALDFSIHDNVWDGSDTTKDMAEAYYGSAGHIYNNYVGYVTNAFVTVHARYFWGNTFDHVARTTSFDATAHMQSIFNQNGDSIIYNNYIISPGGGSTINVESNDNQAHYVFNNVVIDDGNQTIQVYNDRFGPIETNTYAYVFNNTFQSSSTGAISGPSNAGYPNLKYGYAYNNHVMGTAPVIDWKLTTNPVDLNNPKMTNTVATAAGYVATGKYPFYPADRGGVTIGAGKDLRSIAAGIPSTTISDAATAALSDTSCGVKYDAANHRVIGPNRTSVVRGTQWDIGAYQFTGSQIAPPQNLKITP